MLDSLRHKSLILDLLHCSSREERRVQEHNTCSTLLAERWKNQAFGISSFAATRNTSMLAKAELGETLTY